MKMPFDKTKLLPALCILCFITMLSPASGNSDAIADQRDLAEHKGSAVSKRPLSGSTMTATINAPLHYVWGALVNFDNYPDIFNRLQSVSVTKRDGNFVYLESHLKPQMFVKSPIQHTVNDIGGAPEHLSWHLVDGNFKHVEGEWHLKSISDTVTQVTYRLAIDPGPVIPPALVSFVVQFVQRDIFNSFTQYAEKSFQNSR